MLNNFQFGKGRKPFYVNNNHKRKLEMSSKEITDQNECIENSL